MMVIGWVSTVVDLDDFVILSGIEPEITGLVADDFLRGYTLTPYPLSEPFTMRDPKPTCWAAVLLTSANAILCTLSLESA